MNVTHMVIGSITVALAIIGLAWTMARVFDGIERAWDWLRRDRVTPLLEDDRFYGPHEEGCACEECELPPLPPERTWEQMTSHQLPVTEPPGYVMYSTLSMRPERERRPPWWEAEQRQAYEALGFDYPSGLMARVRELAP